MVHLLLIYILVKQLKEYTEYHGYTPDSEIIKWLWELIESFDNTERAEFLQFVTGIITLS